MDVRVEVRDALAVAADGILERCVALRVGRVPAPAVVGVARRLVLVAVAVNVHVGELTLGALQVENSIGIQMVLAIREGWAVFFFHSSVYAYRYAWSCEPYVLYYRPDRLLVKRSISR